MPRLARAAGELLPCCRGHLEAAQRRPCRTQRTSTSVLSRAESARAQGNFSLDAKTMYQSQLLQVSSSACARKCEHSTAPARRTGASEARDAHPVAEFTCSENSSRVPSRTPVHTCMHTLARKKRPKERQEHPRGAQKSAKRPQEEPRICPRSR